MALFNTGEEPLDVALDVADLGLPRADNLTAVNIWTGGSHQIVGTTLPNFDPSKSQYPQLTATVAAHGVTHFKIITHREDA